MARVLFDTSIKRKDTVLTTSLRISTRISNIEKQQPRSSRTGLAWRVSHVFTHLDLANASDVVTFIDTLFVHSLAYIINWGHDQEHLNTVLDCHCGTSAIGQQTPWTTVDPFGYGPWSFYSDTVLYHAIPGKFLRRRL
jgi:hypothetical protein